MCLVCPHVGSMFARESGPGRGGLCQIWPERGLRCPTWVGQWSIPLLGVLSFDSLIQLRSVKPAGSGQSHYRRTGRAGRGRPEVLRMRGLRHRCSSVTSAGGPLRLNRRVRWRPPGRLRAAPVAERAYRVGKSGSGGHLHRYPPSQRTSGTGTCPPSVSRRLPRRSRRSRNEGAGTTAMPSAQLGAPQALTPYVRGHRDVSTHSDTPRYTA